jgi:lipoic acid synthetase
MAKKPFTDPSPAPAVGTPIKKRVPLGTPHGQVHGILRKQTLRTVCEDANCPNRHECYAHGTATFIVLGDVCTRRCPYCSIPQGKPEAVDETEPDRLADAAERMKLRHVVITSVNRDELPDGGSGHFARCIAAVRDRLPAATVEVLTPDFLGKREQCETVFAARPQVFNHNIETVPRLFKPCRPGGKYPRSLEVLRWGAAAMSAQREAGGDGPRIEQVKSGLMVGLGETREEISEVLRDLHAHGVTVLTVGQYLKSWSGGVPVRKYYTLEEFDAIRDEALGIGFAEAFCGPYVRSSYHAGETFLRAAGAETG